MRRLYMNKEKKEIITEKVGIGGLEFRIAASVVICYLSAAAFSELGIKYTYGEMHLEILQKMTACIACLLCVQDNTKISRKAGINRLIITAIGGITGIGAAVADNAIGSPWFMAVIIFAGILLTLVMCKMARVPYVNARIGGVTFILVSCTFAGNARIFYALFRFISTFYGVLVVLFVTWTSQKITAAAGKQQVKGTEEAGGNKAAQGIYEGASVAGGVKE